MNLNDKVEEGIDSELVLRAIINNITQVNPSDYYKSNISPQQINNINNKIKQYLSCSSEKNIEKFTNKSIFEGARGSLCLYNNDCKSNKGRSSNHYKQTYKTHDTLKSMIK